MLRVLAGLLVVITLLCGGLAGLVWSALEDTPRISIDNTAQLDDADQVDALFKQLQSSILARDSASTLEVSEVQLESLQGFFRRASVKVSGDAIINDGEGILRGTLAVELKQQDKFINAEVWINQGDGLPLNKVVVGKVSIPGWLAKQIVKYGINLYTSSDSGSQLLATINNVKISGQRVTVGLNPLGPLLDELRRIDTGMNSPRDQFIERHTALFLRALEAYETKHGSRTRSLHDYIHHVFGLAATEYGEHPAEDVNEAAILSLAIFSGHYRIGTFVGDVQLDVDNPSTPNHMPTLGGRVDLAQHFIISAALKVLSKRGLSLAIGEFKELMDRAQGGSGYSFVDLAADRAGVHFASELTEPESARLAQQRVAAASAEAVYFPSIDGLIEGLDKQAFVARYGQVDSQSYKKEVNRISWRVRNLPLYAAQ